MTVRITHQRGPFGTVDGGFSDSESLGAFGVSVLPVTVLPMVYLRASRHAYLALLPRFGGDKTTLEAWLVRFGLGRLEAALRSGTPAEDLPRETMLKQADVEGEPPSEKACGFQSREFAGLFCRAAAPNDQLEGRTSVPLCGTCDLPDDRDRCSALVHPRVFGWDAPAEHPREVVAALCDAGHHDRVTTPSLCVATGHGCWHRDVQESGAAMPVPAPDVAERLVDEFSYTRLALETALGVKTSPAGGDLTLARVILSECLTESDFTTHVTAAGGLLEQLDGRKRLAEEGGADSSGKGPLEALGLLLEQAGFSGFQPDIAALRDISTIRRLAPVHRVMDARGLAALGRFGISPPIADWGEAWSRVAERTRGALRSLRLAVEAGPDPELESETPPT